MENGYRALVWSDSFTAAQESPLRAAQETVLKSKSLVASMSVPAPAPRPKGVPQPIRQMGIDPRWEKILLLYFDGVQTVRICYIEVGKRPG